MVWQDGKKTGHAIDTEKDKYTDGYKDDAFDVTEIMPWTEQVDGSLPAQGEEGLSVLRLQRGSGGEKTARIHSQLHRARRTPITARQAPRRRPRRRPRFLHRTATLRRRRAGMTARHGCWRCWPARQPSQCASAQEDDGSARINRSTGKLITKPLRRTNCPRCRGFCARGDVV